MKTKKQIVEKLLASQKSVSSIISEACKIGGFDYITASYVYKLRGCIEKKTTFSKKRTIEEAIKKVGFHTSISSLSKEAAKIYKKQNGITAEFGFRYVCETRRRLKKEKGLDVDNRTYKSQPRRDMFRDDKISRQKYDKAVRYLKEKKLKELTSCFHSIEQMKTFLDSVEMIE